MDIRDGENDLEQPAAWHERALAALRRPIGFALVGIALVGLLAFLYLNQVAGVTRANTELRALQTEQTRLQREDAQLRARLGEVTSPAYVEQRARQLGLRPSDLSAIIVALRTADLVAGGQR